jgi:SNF2 family DNA or RNA helicase
MNVIQEIPGVDFLTLKKQRFEGWCIPISLLEMGRLPACLNDYEPEVNDTTPSGLKLHPYQLKAVTFLRQLAYGKEGAILAGDAGLGKTLISLHSLWLDGLLQKPGVIVGPSLSIPTWCDSDSDATLHYGIKVKGLSGVKNIDPSVLQSWPYFFCHFDILYAWQAWIFQILKPQWMICDESHFLANQNSQMSVATRQLALNASIRRRYALTGTPIPNSRLELWAQLAIAQPRQWGVSRHKFGLRYCAGELMPLEEGGHWDYSGESNTEELRARLAGSYLRFTQEDANSPTIPKLVRHVIETEITDTRLMEDYSLAQRDTKKYLQSKDPSLKEKKKLQVGNSVVQLTHKDRKEPMALICFATLISILSKIKRRPALRAAIELLDTHRKLVIFTWHTEMTMWLFDQLSAATPELARTKNYPGLKVYGPATRKMHMSRRKELAVRFSRADSGIYIGTLASVGTSINHLSAASACLQTELTWNTVRLLQGEKRVQREGCPWKTVHAYYLVCRSTIDDYFINTLHEKAQVISKVTPRDSGSAYLVRDLVPDKMQEGSNIDSLCKSLCDTSLDGDWEA